MTVKEAEEIAMQFYRKGNPTEEETNAFLTAMNFLIEEQQDPRAMLTLGGWYYNQHDFEKSLWYYQMAADAGSKEADLYLAYIYYYGRGTEKDLKKAFELFSRAAKNGSIEAEYHLADMYRKGEYVWADDDKYVELIEDIFPKLRNCNHPNDPVPEVFTRLAAIRAKEGKKEEAAALYLGAKDFLVQRIRFVPTFGNLSMMKFLTFDLYQVQDFDKSKMDLYDLYYVLEKPCAVIFKYDGEPYIVKASEEDGKIVVAFNDKTYEDIDDFFAHAAIGDHHLTGIFDQLHDFTVAEIH